jgi:hypothetical protein
MTFGQIKSVIERNLLESYKNDSDFKKLIREFKSNILTDKSMSKLYSIYDQLSTPQGLVESDAREFLDEGIKLIKQILTKVKFPRLNENLESSNLIENLYGDIDTLVYESHIDLMDRISSKKRILKTLMSENVKSNEHISIPIKSMVKIANQTISNYIETLDESSKKELINILSEDSEKLKIKFDVVKENAISKLQDIFNTEKDEETKTKLSETIDKIQSEEFNQINYLRLKNLERSI